MSVSSRAVRGSFDDIEQAWLGGGDDALQGSGPVAGVQMRSARATAGTATDAVGSAPAGAVRVGGNIRVPVKVRSAEPVYPQIAQKAGVQGVVIVELHIGADGDVSNARILGSIPLLDQAAIDAVRQWRYEPTLLNGAAVPVIMTATVNFSLQPPAR
jgi:protein TonB